MGSGHAGAGCQRRRRGRGRQVLGHRPSHGLHHPADRGEAAGQALGEAAVLAERNQVGLEVGAQPGRHVGGGDVVGERRGREVGPGVDAVAPHHPGLAAVHGLQSLAGIHAQTALTEQAELPVEHHALAAPGDHG